MFKVKGYRGGVWSAKLRFCIPFCHALFVAKNKLLEGKFGEGHLVCKVKGFSEGLMRASVFIFKLRDDVYVDLALETPFCALQPVYQFRKKQWLIVL